MKWAVVCCVSVLLWCTPVTAQDAPPAPSCEQQVAAAYQRLIQDQLLPQTPATTPQAQLPLMVRQLRIVAEQYRMADSDMHAYQSGSAILREHVRELTEQLQQAKQELQQAKEP